MGVHYQLETRSEDGELAELHRGVRVEDGAKVEVKLFHAFTSDPGYAREVIHTSQALEAVHSGGPLRVLDVGVVEGRLAVVRECVEGPSLGQLLQRLSERGQHLPLPVALSLLVGLGEDLHVAHEAGVTHGGLTPGNLWIGEGGGLRIADFGSMRALLSVPALKRALAPRGRTVYRAPEVDGGPSSLTPAADLYALGAIAYELLTQEEVQFEDGEVVPPSRVAPRLTSRMDGPVLRALALEPERRTRSAGDLAVGLRTLLNERGGPPGAAPLRELIDALFPPEERAREGRPPALAGPFQLQKIEGAELASVRVLEAPPKPRRSYSRRARDAMQPPPDELPTEEASPELLAAALGAFYARVPAMSDDSSRATPLETQSPRDPTDAATAPDVEAWDAPAAPAWVAPTAKPDGEAPARKSALSLEGSGVRRTGRHGRLKLIEDFAPLEDEEVSQVGRPRRAVGGGAPARASGHRRAIDDEVSQAGAAPRARGTGARRAIGADSAVPPRSSGVRKSIIPHPEIEERDSLAEYEQQLKDQKRQKELEATQRAYLAQRQKKLRDKLLRFVVAFVVLLAMIVGLALYFQESLRPDFTPPPPVPIGVAAEDAKFLAFGPLETTEAAPPAEAPKAAATVKGALLTIRSNHAAEIYLDGDPIKRRAPGTNIPIKKLGRVQVDVVSLESKERKTFQANFEKGKTHSIDVQFSGAR